MENVTLNSSQALKMKIHRAGGALKRHHLDYLSAQGNCEDRRCAPSSEDTPGGTGTLLWPPRAHLRPRGESELDQATVRKFLFCASMKRVSDKSQAVERNTAPKDDQQKERNFRRGSAICLFGQ